jgi:hypothetical protein
MWRYAMVGGIGGLAPIGCQILGQLMPNFGNSDNVAQMVAHFIPQTLGGWLVVVIGLLAIFLIAAGVVCFSSEGDTQKTYKKSFLLGLSVPGMILSVGNGYLNPVPISASNSSSKTTWDKLEQHEYVTWRANGARMLISLDTSRKYFAAGEPHPGEFRVSVTCPECSSGLNLTALVNRLTLKSRPSGLTNTVDVTSDSNPSEWLPLPVTDIPQSITISVPGYEQDPKNSQIWRAAETTFEAKAGQRWTVQILLRPGIFNSGRALFGRPPFYVIEGITASTMT